MSAETLDAARRPRAIRLDASEAATLVVDDYYEQEAALALARPDLEGEAAVVVAQQRGIVRRTILTWGGLFWSAALGLAGTIVLAEVTSTVESLFARSPTLGAIAGTLAVLALLALAVGAGREMLGVARQRQIARLHAAFAAARAADDTDAARKLVGTLVALYAARPDTATARAELAALSKEIVDGRDLCDAAEHALMAPLDEAARAAIATAAKRVSVVTTFAPRAIFDVVFVAAQALRLIRRIAEIYGGRPGVLGLLKLGRSVLVHLAVTANMAVGDSLLQQVVGHGVAAKLSARLGESVLNGLLTTRVGLSAMAVCRPMPYAARPAPGVRDVAPFLFRTERPRPQP